MRAISKSALGCCVVLGLLAPASGQSTRPASPDIARQDTLTGKERLGRKWTDEQRIDNCNVPLDKRGAKLRPSDCPHTPSS